jgi:hypothetical protein
MATDAFRADMLPAQGPDPRLKLLGDEIAELSAHLDAATARLLERIREFDARGGWNTGFRSCAEWLAWRVSLDLGAAREKVRVARALGSLPRLAAALARGELSYAKVRALTRVATPDTEERLLAIGRAGTAAHIERIVRGWRWMDRTAEARDTALRHQGRALHVYQDDDGTVMVRGRLAPEVGALLIKALDAARESLYQRAPVQARAESPRGRRRRPARRRAPPRASLPPPATPTRTRSSARAPAHPSSRAGSSPRGSRSGARASLRSSRSRRTPGGLAGTSRCRSSRLGVS